MSVPPPTPTSSPSDHVDRFFDNAEDVVRLSEIHTATTGATPGRKHKVEVLNKSAIVLLTACWEAFVEDMASAAFDVLLAEAPDHTAFPMSVLTRVSKALRTDADERAPWRLAGDGWRTVLQSHRAGTLKRYVGKLNTPRAEQVDELYSAMIGLNGLSTHWHWHSVTSAQATQRHELVTLRGEIAHRVSAPTSVQKKDVQSYQRFVTRLVIASHEATADYLGTVLGARPWDSVYAPAP